MEWDEDEIVVEITADVVEVEIAETATDVTVDEEKIELEIAAPEETGLEITEDLIELELVADPEIVIETGEGSGKAVWGFITGELPDQTDLAAALDGKSDTGHTHDDRYYTEQEIDAALAVISAALSGKSDVGHTHDGRYYTQSEIDAALAVINTALAGKSNVGHTHDDRYYTKSEIDAALQVINTALAGKSNTGHTHDNRYYTESEMDTKLSSKVSKSGDTMTGILYITKSSASYIFGKSTDLTLGTTPSSEQNFGGFYCQDKNDINVGYIEIKYTASGDLLTRILARNRVNGANVDNLLQIGVSSNGTRKVTVTDASVWRSGLGITPANIGALPTSGGTVTGTLNLTGAFVQPSGALFGQASENYNHALKLGHPDDNLMSFHEYGGLFRFYKSQNGTNTLLGEINSSGFKGDGSQLTGLSSLFVMTSTILSGGAIAKGTNGPHDGTTITRSGYKPLMFSARPGSYCNYLSFHFGNMAISGSSVVTGTYYVGNWSTSDVPGYHIIIDVLWIKE